MTECESIEGRKGEKRKSKKGRSKMEEEKSGDAIIAFDDKNCLEKSEEYELLAMEFRMIFYYISIHNGFLSNFFF